MAQRTEIFLIDDVDESAATETINFGLDGATYEIDLSDDNAHKLRRDLEMWTRSARRTGGRKTRRR